MRLTKFTMTDDHLALLRKMNVGWQDTEFGAPEIDPKRPYGNSSVETDIHKILTGESVGYTDSQRDELTEQELARYQKLHRETETALQIVLAVGMFEAGAYECDAYRINWRKVQWTSSIGKPSHELDDARGETMTSRSKTAAEVCHEFLNHVMALSRYWSTIPDKTAQERCDGLAFSIMVIFDGGAMGLPAIDLVLDPHHDDQLFYQSQGENWYEPGQIINSDCQLHELLVRR